MLPVRILERAIVFTPLGLRFWDPVSGTTPRDGLLVTAAPDLGDRLGPERPAFVTGSGVFALHKLPGLRDVERPAQPPAVTSPQPAVPYVLRIRDLAGHYLPAALRLSLPLPYRGLFPRDPAEPPGAGGNRRFVLFSAPSRPVPLWRGLVTGRLQRIDGRSAGHAALVVDLGGGVVHHGLADAAGVFAIQFPFPEIPPDAAVSPPQGRALGSLEWPFELRVFYNPGALVPLPGLDLPDYLAALDQLAGPSAQVFAILPADGGTPLASLLGVLRRSDEAVARTAGSSALVIAPVTGSP